MTENETKFLTQMDLVQAYIDAWTENRLQEVKPNRFVVPQFLTSDVLFEGISDCLHEAKLLLELPNAEFYICVNKDPKGAFFWECNFAACTMMAIYKELVIERELSKE